jgi:hypothetical protein
MNFLVASQSTHYRVTAYVDQNQSLTKYSRQTEGNLSLANLVVNAIYNPPNPEWKRGHYTPGDKDTCSSHPWGWGQRSMYSMEPPSKLWSFGSGMSEFFILDNQTARFMVNYPAN